MSKLLLVVCCLVVGSVQAQGIPGWVDIDFGKKNRVDPREQQIRELQDRQERLERRIRDHEYDEYQQDYYESIYKRSKAIDKAMRWNSR